MYREDSLRGPDDAAAHAIREFDFLFCLLFSIDIEEATPQRIERKFKEIPDDCRPPPDLPQRMMTLRETATTNRHKLVEEDVKELVAGIEQFISITDSAESPHD